MSQRAGRLRLSGKTEKDVCMFRCLNPRRWPPMAKALELTDEAGAATPLVPPGAAQVAKTVQEPTAISQFCGCFRRRIKTRVHWNATRAWPPTLT